MSVFDYALYVKSGAKTLDDWIEEEGWGRPSAWRCSGRSTPTSS